jgi:ABC-2 type transport system ATP-binding protein
MISCQHIYYGPKKSDFQLLIDKRDFDQEGITAFVGPNGAGKSTLFKVMAGIEAPTSGEAKFEGMNVFKDYEVIKNKIHLLTWDISPYSDVSALDLLKLMKSLAIQWDDTREGILINQFQLPLDRNLSSMSRGQQAKVRLLLSLPQSPKLILIDEITNELDNDTRKNIYKLLDEYSFETHAQVFIATNILEDMERYASNIVFMKNGKILDYGKIDEMKERDGKSLEAIYQGITGV